MAHDDDLPDIEDIDGVLDDRQAIQVGVDYHIGHIAVNKQLSRHEPDDFVGGNPAVRAADPEILGILLMQQLLEELGVAGVDPFGPLPVTVDQLLKCFHGRTSFVVRVSGKTVAKLTGQLLGWSSRWLVYSGEFYF